MSGYKEKSKDFSLYMWRNVLKCTCKLNMNAPGRQVQTPKLSTNITSCLSNCNLASCVIVAVLKKSYNPGMFLF